MDVDELLNDLITELGEPGAEMAVSSRGKRGSGYVTSKLTFTVEETAAIAKAIKDLLSSH